MAKQEAGEQPDKAKELRPLPRLAEWYARQHADEQEELASKIASGLSLLWRIIRAAAENLDEVTIAWLHSVTLQIEFGWNESADLAFEFVQASKWSIEPDSEPLVKVDTPFPAQEVQTAMRVTGPIEVKRQVERAVPEQDALEAADKKSAGVGSAKALDGGRAQVMNQIAAEGRRNAAAEAVRDRHWVTLQGWKQELSDLEAQGRGDSGRAGRLRELIAPAEVALQDHVPSAEALAGELEPVKTPPDRRTLDIPRPAGVVGFARQTDSDPCYFCALLASLGAVFYSKDSFKSSNDKIRDMDGVPRAFFGDGVAKVHDWCKCTMRPVYRIEDSMDERAKYFLDQWNKFSAGLSGKEALKNFRNNYVPPPPYGADALDSKERKQLIADVRRNREALLARGFEANSPNVKFLDKSIRKLEA